MLFSVYSTTYREPDSEILLKEYPQLSKFGYRGGRIEVDSIEDLMRLSKEVDCELVIGGDRDPSKPRIEIYDGYRE